PRGRKRLELFTAPAENKRVAALQPHDVPTAARAIDKHLGNLFLRKLARRALLADINTLGRCRRKIQQTIVREVVVQHGVRAFEHTLPLDRQQPGISRPRSDEIDFHAAWTSLRISLAPRSRSCAPSVRPIDSGSGPLSSPRTILDPSGDATIAC